MLIVGGDDQAVLELSKQAYTQLRCEKRLEIIPGATHLFEEPGALEAVASLASAWFRLFLVERTAPGAVLGSPPRHPPAAELAG
jgi:putative phosphoribosyl transferase